MDATTKQADSDVALTEAGPALLLRLSIKTPQAWRCKGVVPALVQAERAILLAWMAENTVSPKASAAAAQ
jgi:hypothetical protein